MKHSMQIKNILSHFRANQKEINSCTEQEAHGFHPEMQDCILDFRELVDEKTLDLNVAILRKGLKVVRRIHVGSSFCPNYFLHCGIYHKLIDYCRTNNIKISLSTCVFPQSLVMAGMQAVQRLLFDGDGIIDELVVNDIGMLRYATTNLRIKTVLGRLFFKDPRDGRFPKFIDRRTTFSLLSHSDLFEEWHPFGIEIDPISNQIDLSQLNELVGLVVLNSPFCYMSCGNLCRAASAFKPLNKKFRPSAPCALECLETASIHNDRLRNESRTLFMVGKTVYFNQPSVRVICSPKITLRRLYFPLNEFINRLQGQCQ